MTVARVLLEWKVEENESSNGDRPLAVVFLGERQPGVMSSAILWVACSL